MSERQQRFRLGLFVLITLGLLAALVIVFGGAPSWFTAGHTYTMFFTDAPGIAKGTPVRKSGVKVGEVMSIDLDDATGQVRVTVRLDPKFTPRTSDEPTVTRGLLVSDTSIDFIPKAADVPQLGEAIPPGSTIQGVSPFNARVLIDQATGVVPEAQKSLQQLRKSLEAFDRLSPMAEDALREIASLSRASREFVPELRRTNESLREFFANTSDLGPALKELGPALKDLGPDLRKTTDEVRYFFKMASFWVEEVGVTMKKHEPAVVKAIDTITTTTERLGEVLNPDNQKAISETLKNVRDASTRFEKLTIQAEDLMKDGKTAMKSLNASLSQADQAMSELRQATRPLSERSARILQNVESGSDQFNKAMVEVRELVRAIGRSEGAFQKFIADPALYNNLNETAVIIGKLAPRLERILKDVEVFADKIARHPESLGVGGALRPDSGLKDSIPSTPGHKPRVP